MSNSPPERAAGGSRLRFDARPRMPRPSWHASRDSDVLVQLYQDEGPLIASASGFLKGALLDGAAALVIVTPTHGRLLDEAIAEGGVDVVAARQEGRYVSLDAAETLEAVAPGGTPDPGAFLRVLGRTLDALEGAWPRLAAFEEMGVLLRDNGRAGHTVLEDLWTECLSEHPMVRLSAYRVDSSSGAAAVADIARLCSARCQLFLTERSAAAIASGPSEDEQPARGGSQAVGADRDRALLAAIVTGSDDAIVSKDVEGRITSWNGGAERLFGYTAEEAVGQHISMLLPEERLDEGPEILARIRAGEHVDTYETVRRRKDGTDVEITLTVSPLTDSDGRVVGASKIARAFTQERKAERQLREAEAYYRRLTDLLPIGIYTCDARGAITYYNQQAVRLWGRAPELGERAFGAPGTGGEGAEAEESPLSLALNERRSFRNEELAIERADGSRVTVLVDIDPVTDEHGKLLGTVIALHDVTEVKRAERELREQREQLETLLETVPVPVFLAHDPDARKISGNRAAAELFRMPATANLSMAPPPGEEAPSLRAFRNGKVVPAEELPLQRAARGFTVSADEIDYSLEDGTILRTLVSARPLFGVDGKPRGAVAALMDVTELKASADALREADRLKNEFLATLSHELRNPLAPILTGLEVMRVSHDADTLERTRATVERQSLQLVRLVDDLLDIARITRGRLELRRREIQLADVIEQAVDAVTPTMKQYGHTFDVEQPSLELRVHGDSERLVQVLGNLLHNAALYTPPKGRVTLRIERTGGEVAVVVEDTGVGIPLDMRERVFEMFAQVHRSHEGGHTGLGVGLTLARSLVELHGGTLEVESPGLDLGSTFTVRLPLLAQAAPAALAIEPVEAAPAASIPRRVLIVDDNEAFIESLSILIETLGHDVRTAADGAEALEIGAELHPHIVLMDLGMPGMNGYDAARRMREEPWGRDITLVALTGWGRAEDKRRTREAGFDHHMVKPPQPAELRRLLAV